MIRQKKYEIFIKPYTMYTDNNSDINRLIHEGSVFIKTPNSTTANAYSALQGGECWMLHKENIRSLQEAQQEVKKLMDTLGYPKEAIKLREAIPLDYVITPLR